MDQTDEDFNYDSHYKKICTGLGSFLNTAQQNSYFEEGGCASGSNTCAATNYSANELSMRKKIQL